MRGREREIKKGRRYEALEGINNRRGVFKGKKKKRREKRCQRHQKLKYKSILFSYLSLTCSLTYTHTRIVSKKGSGYETNKPRHPLQFTHTIPPINIPPSHQFYSTPHLRQQRNALFSSSCHCN